MSIKNSFYKKEYLPGYTGHVPYKNDLYGITAGDANKVLISPKGKESFFKGTLVGKPGNQNIMIEKKNQRSQKRVFSTARSSFVHQKAMKTASLLKKKGVFTGRAYSVGNESRQHYNQNVMFGNNSRKAINWICGPTDKV